MLVSHPKKDFEAKFDYYFKNQFGDLSHFQSEEKLEVGSLIYLSSIGDYLYRVKEIIQKEGKMVTTFESPKVIVCDQPFPFRSL